MTTFGFSGHLQTPYLTQVRHIGIRRPKPGSRRKTLLDHKNVTLVRISLYFKLNVSLTRELFCVRNIVLTHTTYHYVTTGPLSTLHFKTNRDRLHLNYVHSVSLLGPYSQLSYIYNRHCYRYHYLLRIPQTSQDRLKINVDERHRHGRKIN